MVYNRLHTKFNELKKNTIPKQNLDKGISIIIPVYDGGEFIESCLDSLKSQHIVDAKFEIIIIFNGKFESDYRKLFNEKGDYFNKLDITIMINDKKGVGSARNIGMKAAKYSHITFIDIDDYVSPEFIQASFNYLEDNTITFTQIHNIEDGLIDEENLINNEIIKAYHRKVNNILDVNRVSTITVCKMIPKEIALLQQFREHLRSGEDTVFFSEMFVNSRPRISIIPPDDKAIYYRRIRQNSVSRKKTSFDFSVFQRLEILEILDIVLNKISNPLLLKFVLSKYNAQISFMNRFLTENPDKRKDILNTVERMSLNNFNYSILNRGIAETLVVSYCFPPFSDTSATIVAKRLINNDKVVDVVSNNMGRIRSMEPSLNELVKPLVGGKITINSSATFSNMYYLNTFINKSFSHFLKNADRYTNVYSRAMFPISHIPPLFMKIVKSEIKWTAEFSDPLLMNIESNERNASLDNVMFVKSLKNGMLGNFSKYVDDNLFNVSELIPFALADELIFTNPNQLEYMIDRFSENEKDFIRNKSIIKEHPTLDKTYYSVDNIELDIEKAVVNIAYFGNFYSRRGYNNFVKLVEQLNENFELTFRLHLYTNKNQLHEDDLKYLNNNNVKVNNYLPFTKFLNATIQFDLLLISDAKTSEDKPFNPYLPSKLSDYLGSSTPVLALTEKSSVMSQIDRDFLYKIDIQDFETQINTSSLHENNTLVELIEHVKLRKLEEDTDRKLIYSTNGIQLRDQNFYMSMTKDLALLNVDSHDWLIKPKNSPVTTKNDYETTIHNFSDNYKEIGVKSFYRPKNIIKIDFIYNENNEEHKEKKSFCISKLIKGYKKLEIPPNSSLIIKIRYLKNYKNHGFINAGRLHVKGL